MSKLYLVSLIDDAEEYYEIVVANSEKEAEEKVIDMDKWSCLMHVAADEIDVVNDGYRVKLEKIKE